MNSSELKIQSQVENSQTENSQMEDYPEDVYVSGMPLCLRGFNGRYKRNKNNPLRWDRQSSMYMCIYIRPTSIIKQGNHFVLVTTDYFQSQIACSNNLLGNWSDSRDIHLIVTERSSFQSWLYSNCGIIGCATTILIPVVSISMLCWSKFN